MKTRTRNALLLASALLFFGPVTALADEPAPAQPATPAIVVPTPAIASETAPLPTEGLVPLEVVPPKAALPPVEPEPAKITTAQPKRSVLTFEDTEVLGTGNGPSLNADAYLDTIIRARHSNLIRLREDFRNEIENSYYGLGG